MPIPNNNERAVIGMSTRVKKNRRKNKQNPPAGWRVGTPVFDLREMDAHQTAAKNVIYDATGDDLVISEVSDEEFAEAGRGYLVGGTVKLPGGGEVAIIYPDDDPDANPNDPPATDFAAPAPGEHATGILAQLWEKLADFSSTVIQKRNLPLGTVLVGGFHLFPSTPERVAAFGANCLLSGNDALPVLVPVHWLVLENEVALNQVNAQAVDPRLIAQLMSDIVSAEQSEDAEQALRVLIEDPLRYLGEMA